MNAEALYDRSPSLSDAENWLALSAGALLLLAGASRRSAIGACLAVSSAPLLYRGVTGHWPNVINGHAEANATRAALGGERGVHVRESVRLEVPVADAYRFWRRLDNLPQFGTISIPGAYGGWLDKFTLGAAFAKGLTLKMGQTHMNKYMPILLERIERGEIDPSFIITHRIGLEDAPAMYRTFRDKDDSCIKVVITPGAAHADRPTSVHP